MVVILYRILASVSYDENVTVVNASIITEFPWTWWKKKRWLHNNSSMGDCVRPADHFAVWTMIPACILALTGDSVFSSTFSLLCCDTLGEQCLLSMPEFYSHNMEKIVVVISCWWQGEWEDV